MREGTAFLIQGQGKPLDAGVRTASRLLRFLWLSPDDPRSPQQARPLQSIKYYRESGFGGMSGDGRLWIGPEKWAALFLRPGVRILRKSRSLYTYDAEALSGWRFHHHPSLQAIHDLRAQRLKARDLSGYIVALNIDMNAAFMVHTLYLNNRFVGRSLQHIIISASTWVIGIQRAT